MVNYKPHGDSIDQCNSELQQFYDLIAKPQPLPPPLPRPLPPPPRPIPPPNPPAPDLPPERVPRGLFKALPDLSAVYYSNGQDRYCWVPDPAMLPLLGATNSGTIPQYVGKPTRMGFDPECSWPPGLFVVGLGNDYYYSNGQHHYCHVPNPTYLHAKFPGQKPAMFPKLPPKGYDGDCQ